MAGFGLDTGRGGVPGLVDNLGAQDTDLVGLFNADTPLFHSWWSVFAILIAHIPLGLLPHLGNKLWALKDTRQQRSFVGLAFAFGLTLGMLGLAGLLARALLGEALYAEGANPNQALPLLFIELFPVWLAALVGVGILAAIMSTADGLVISSSQIIANDLYRRTVVPRLKRPPSAARLDHTVLYISRVSTVVVLLLCTALAWALIETNIALIVWIGNGGLMAAFAGPLVVGALWRGVTRAGAYAGLVSGFVTFFILHIQLLDPAWFSPGVLHTGVTWLYVEGPSPFSCAALGEFVSVGFTFVVSKATQPLPEPHVPGAVRGRLRHGIRTFGATCHHPSSPQSRQLRHGETVPSTRRADSPSARTIFRLRQGYSRVSGSILPGSYHCSVSLFLPSRTEHSLDRRRVARCPAPG